MPSNEPTCNLIAVRGQSSALGGNAFIAVHLAARRRQDNGKTKISPFFCIFLVHEKNRPRWPQMGPGGFFPTNPDLADILGDTDFDFENFYFWDFFGSQISGLGPLGPHVGPLGPRVGPPTWAPRGPTHLGPTWAHPLGPLGWAPRVGPSGGAPRVGPQMPTRHSRSGFNLI